jgi:histidine triad (HIT) family protein
MSDCLFCAIVAGDIPADVVYSDDVTIAFRDLNPQAPTHVLVIPREHYADAGEAGSADAALGGALLSAAAKVAEQEGVAVDGYRIVANTGVGAGQTVFHAHLHVLGGRPLTWPPG